jgi:hypothetical protein
MGNLKKHQHTYTRERPQSCDVCDKSFIQKCDLKIHQRIHSVGGIRSINAYIEGSGLIPVMCDHSTQSDCHLIYGSTGLV